MTDLVLAGGTVVTAEASFRADVAVTGGIVKAAQARRLLVGRNVDTAAGLDNVIALAPPLSLTDEDAGHVVDVMGAVFAEHSSKGVTS